MKISELIALLEQRKEEFGDVDVRIWNDEQYTSTRIVVNNYLSDSDGWDDVAHYVGIFIAEEDK